MYNSVQCIISLIFRRDNYITIFRKYSRSQLTLLVWCLEFAGNNVSCMQRLYFQYLVVDALTMIFFS